MILQYSASVLLYLLYLAQTKPKPQYNSASVLLYMIAFYQQCFTFCGASQQRAPSFCPTSEADAALRTF